MSYDIRTSGLMTAMVTPFTAENKVDFPAVDRLVEHLIETGTQVIVVNGTTGESPTVTHAEKRDLLKTVQQAIGGRSVGVVAATGSYDTQTTIDLSREAEKMGVDGLLVVVPYYNKPSQSGMFAHFHAVAEAVRLPIIMYNIPGRCVVTMAPETMARLASQHANIIGVKQSCGDMDQVSDLRRKAPQGFQIWSGDDSLTLPMMALGGAGVISVAAHLTGPLIREMVEAMKAGQVDKARALHLQQFDVFRELFFLPNPTVLKTCLAQTGLIEGHLRLPLVPPDPLEMKRIEALMAMLHTLSPITTAAKRALVR